MPISLFSFLFSLFGNEKCGGTKHQSFFLSLPTTTTNQPSPSGIVNDCREKASNSQVFQQEKHFEGLSLIFRGRNYLQSFDVNPCTLRVDFVHR